MTSLAAPLQPGPVSNAAKSRVEIRIDRTPKRIRVHRQGLTIADSTGAHLAYCSGKHPQYLLPNEDIDWVGLERDAADPDHDEFGSYRTVVAQSSEIGRHYISGPAAGSTAFVFAAMDAWFEEEEQIWFHARDPFRRVDVIESSRHVDITVNGQVIASSVRPRLVTETGLPARWYIPRADIDWSKLRPSATTSGCQYKGLADWWHVKTDDADELVDVVWGYERPVVEAVKLAGLVAVYAEHAAVETWVDEVLQPKPILDSAALNPSLGLDNLKV